MLSFVWRAMSTKISHVVEEEEENFEMQMLSGGSMNEFPGNIEMSDQQMNECEDAGVTT